MNDKKIVMCGCTEAGINMIDYLFSNGIIISYFVSLTPEQAQQYQVSGYVSFEEVSKKYNVPIYYPKTYSLKHENDIQFFKQMSFDLLILGGWQRLIPQEILTTLTIGGLGFHGSSEFLPKGRGRSPINWSLIEDKQQFILHLFLMTPKVDDGDIVAYELFDINQWDTCRTLYYKNSIVSKRMLVKYIPKILSGDLQTIQQKGEPTYYPKRTPEDGLIDWNKNVSEIYNFIRALTKPYPGAFTYLNGNKVFIWEAQPFDTKITYPNSKKGEIVEVFSTGNFLVNCNPGLLLVTECNTNVFTGQIFTSNLTHK